MITRRSILAIVSKESDYIMCTVNFTVIVPYKIDATVSSHCIHLRGGLNLEDAEKYAASASASA